MSIKSKFKSKDSKDLKQNLIKKKNYTRIVLNENVRENIIIVEKLIEINTKKVKLVFIIN